MFSKADGLTGIVLSLLLFPTIFQGQLLNFAMGFDDPLWMLLAKRLLLLMPIAALIFSLWLSIPILISVIIRHKRQEYLSKFIVTWWDVLRSIFSYWGGIARFIFYLIGWIAGLLRMIAMGAWLTLQDIFLSPLRMVKGMSEDSFKAGTPWLAVSMTLFWSVIESILFTFIMTPLVMDVLSGMAGAELSESLVQVVLFIMLLFFVLGSYAVLFSWGDAIKKKDIPSIIQIGVFELFVLAFEVVFLYREFVDALAPWFAQHTGGEFKLGLFSTLAIAGMAWLGIRGMTWFLFASSGTPTIMAIIQRTGLQISKSDKTSSSPSTAIHFTYIKNAIQSIKNDIDWVHQKGDELLSAFILPPLQIVGALVNFCTLLISSNHLFELPFKSFRDLLQARDLIQKAKDNTKD